MNQLALASHSTYKAAPKYSFTSAAPATEGKRKVPGPGAYGTGVAADKDKFKRSASWSMGASGRDGKCNFQTPGPGAYKPDASKFSPKCVFSTDDRLKEKKRMNVPGPGAYHTVGGADGRQSSISGRPEGLRRATTPGPGAYKPAYQALSDIESTPKVSFGASSRNDMVLSKTPGPGAYDHESFKNGFANSAKYSMSGKYGAPAADRTPGPIAPHTQFK
mmetsp:Transcript_48706/g.122935  ORF Transcript_48706/g.122935 Transcript_48706/m.122935 type:complete len:219 (+) Transcript_48706:97-753(+)|eukprot:CAMPEP_0115302504 /NCGR_PEP_ID=MMETSP0270-20121206/70417_1 /TAXON_ID=71861 /ORGANISM="Scrippsiella trochoidea, Strain CCMP3099" /LENGTH=218 /DNA_ID=CAMNT_0002720433 /DNA_START=8 /DNA_END=664 /DNA_ORIENTATION=-